MCTCNNELFAFGKTAIVEKRKNTDYASPELGKF